MPTTRYGAEYLLGNERVKDSYPKINAAFDKFDAAVKPSEVMAARDAAISTAATDATNKANAARDEAVALGNGTFVRQRTRKVWVIGDSLTAGSPATISYDTNVFSTSGQGGLLFQTTSYPTWALLASGARWTLAGYFATGSFTAAQILANHVPAVIAAASPGDTVVVLAGTNGNVFADAQACHDSLRTAGLNTVAITIPPSTGSTLSAVQAFNAKLRDYARRRDIPLIDAHALLCDPATGAYLSAYNGDGVHPSAAGFQALGYAVNTVLQSLMPASEVDLVQHNAAVTGSLQAHPLALSAVYATDYYNLVAIGTSTVTTGAHSAFRGGQGFIFTRNDTDIDGQFANVTLVPGHRYRIGMALKAEVGGSGSWGMRLESATTGAKTLWGMGYPGSLTLGQADTRFYSEFVVPTLPDYSYRLRWNINGANGVLSIGELTLFDLTAMGLS